MEGIPSGFCRQGVDQQQASIRITRRNKPGYRFKVPPRLLLHPSGGARGELFEMENAARLRVAAVAPRVLGALFQEDGLYLGFLKKSKSKALLEGLEAVFPDCLEFADGRA